MIKRTIEISQRSAHLSVKLDQLIIQPHDQPAESASSIPCEDIGIILIDHGRCTYTHAALAKLSEFGAVVVVCGRDHLPIGMLLPLADHTQVVWRIESQLSVAKPLRKQLWTQIVQAKIRAQAANLPRDSSPRGRLLAMASREVRSGDPTNVEAQAAKIYWSAWLASRGVSPRVIHESMTAPGSKSTGLTQPGSQVKFRRDPKGADPLNLMLNYGYAVVRAAVARAIVGAGLLPVLGLHHHNRSNQFCLADDLMEPLRPMVDRRVRELYVIHGRRELNQPTKAGLLELLTQRVVVGDETRPLMVALHGMVASLVKCYEGSSKKIVFPVAAGDD